MIKTFDMQVYDVEDLEISEVTMSDLAESAQTNGELSEATWNTRSHFHSCLEVSGMMEWTAR